MVLYLISHLAKLLSLPVFADEAIYIRWAQLLRHDAVYRYFSLNDGKPPLFMWITAVFLQAPLNPLFAGRLVSVLVGVGQLWITDTLIKRLKGGWVARLAGALIIITAPFWFFHHRMALMDALLTFFLSLTLYGLLSLAETHTNPRRLLYAVVTGTAWGLALWTKTPALFLAPTFLLVAWLPPLLSQITRKRRSIAWKPFFIRTAWFAVAGALGLSIFLTLKFLHPAFGSLFSRSSDFTFTLAEFFSGSWRTSLDNIGRVTEWIGAYLRPELVALSLFGLVASRQRSQHWLLWLSGIGFIAPLILFGRTLHPRYFLPLALFITPSAALMVEETKRLFPRVKEGDVPWMQSIFVLVIGLYFIGSLRFLFLNLFAPDQTPFVLADRSQYLTEWSSGHGLREIRDALIMRAQRGERTTVVTEGSFGTLPDGLLLEFDARPEIAHLRIEGLAQYPVKYLPDWVYTEAADHETWLVVNENRMELQPAESVELLARYPRPYGAPELQLYRVRPKQGTL